MGILEVFQRSFLIRLVHDGIIWHKRNLINSVTVTCMGWAISGVGPQMVSGNILLRPGVKGSCSLISAEGMDG